MSGTVKDTMHKIDVMWFENVEFSNTLPLTWDDFFAGFTPAERKTYTYFA